MDNRFDKLEQKLDKIDEKLDKSLISVATLQEKVAKLEKEAESQRTFVGAAILTALGAIVTGLFNIFTSRGGL